ncbi:MAG TPA: C-GCAxxG-C-C family protein [bacterium]|nr:C-GCAxxG-C-C family protein [bacterium]
MGTSRRKFLQLVMGSGLTGLLIGEVGSTTPSDVGFTPFDKHTRIDIGTRGSALIEKAYTIGHEYEEQHGGCARCTVAALQNVLPFIQENNDVFRTACCLDGGATPTKRANCGGFTGSGIIIGYVCGTNAFGDTDLGHRLMREVHGKFAQAYGSVLCQEVRKKNHDCPDVVGKAACWTTEIILRQFANYEQNG